MVEVHYSPFLIAASVLVAIMAAFTSLRLTSGLSAQPIVRRKMRIAQASVALGGGIWSMHFIGMLAFDMGMPVSYDVPITALSMILAWAVCAVAFFVVSRGATSFGRIALSGVLMGGGVAIMHYTGMSAMRMPARMSFDTTLVVVSVVIAIVASSVALWLAFNIKKTWQMAAASVVMGVAVTGMHYTGMLAARFTMIESQTPAQVSAISSQFLAYTVFLLSLVILTLAIAFGRVDEGYDDLVTE